MLLQKTLRSLLEDWNFAFDWLLLRRLDYLVSHEVQISPVSLKLLVYLFSLPICLEYFCQVHSFSVHFEPLISKGVFDHIF